MINLILYHNYKTNNFFLGGGRDLGTAGDGCLILVGRKFALELWLANFFVGSFYSVRLWAWFPREF